MVTSILATLFALSFLLFDKVVCSEGPTYCRITSLKLGYWLWLIAIGAFTIFPTVFYLMTRQKTSLKELASV